MCYVSEEVNVCCLYLENLAFGNQRVCLCVIFSVKGGCEGEKEEVKERLGDKGGRVELNS